MWIRKFERDRNKGVTSPVPTQILSTSAERSAKACRTFDRRNVGAESQEAGHGSPQVHGHFHGPGHLFFRDEYGVWQGFRRGRSGDHGRGSYRREVAEGRIFRDG